MIIKTAEFITGALKPSHYPLVVLPEIAFVGRSNVGKSSLINKLALRKKLVKTSRAPGRTQMINFFNINNKITFVDLPGYGYAKVPERVKKNWGPMIETYLATREILRAVVVIIDIRRLPGQEEFDLVNWLNHYNIKIITVLTKSDKLSKVQQIKKLDKAAKTLFIDKSDLILFSAKTGQGRDDLWESIEKRIQ